MPNLVMAVETGCIMLNDHFCILKVYRPVSYTTVLAVLEVPVEHEGSRSMHSNCVNVYGAEPDYVPGQLLPDCAALKALLRYECDFGYARPVDVISRVELYDTGVIHGNSPAHHQKVFSNVLLPAANVEYCGIDSSAEAVTRGQYVTAIQLLKMSVIPSRPSRFGDNKQATRFVEKEKMAIKVWDLECMYAPKYYDWHLSLTLWQDEVDDFVHQVSLSDRDCVREPC
jgi:hypothetical protein